MCFGPSWIWERLSKRPSIGCRVEIVSFVWSWRKFVKSGAEFICCQKSMCQNIELGECLVPRQRGTETWCIGSRFGVVRVKWVKFAVGLVSACE